MSKSEFFEGIGRRKTSTARVRVVAGKAVSTVNDKPYDEYFKVESDSKALLKPFAVVGLDDTYHFTAKVSGGGVNGQVEAIQLGVGRALCIMDSGLKSPLRKAGFVTRDSRMVERKKYNQVKARKKPQFSKR